jgi:LysR family transcriptional regulator, regulator for bpeEF and oprC
LECRHSIAVFPCEKAEFAGFIICNIGIIWIEGAVSPRVVSEMDRILAMQVYVRVVDAKSFVRAAEALALPPSTVTGLIKGLEKHLRVRLLNRTTRSVSPTSDGERYYAQCREILNLIEQAETGLKPAPKDLRGRLRIDMPVGIAHSVILPNLESFRRQYPEIYLMIGVGDRPVDLVQEGVDCVIRTGPLEDSSLVARPLGNFSWITCAAPRYLERYGVPQSLEDLAGHRAVHHFSHGSRGGGNLLFSVDGKRRVVPIDGSVAVNETELYIKLCMQGYGLAQLQRVLVEKQLQDGSLVEVLRQWRPPSVPVSILYPHHRYGSPIVQAFTAWATELFSAKSEKA